MTLEAQAIVPGSLSVAGTAHVQGSDDGRSDDDELRFVLARCGTCR